MLADFVDGGALSERTLARNRDGFKDIDLRNRAFRSTEAPDTRCELFGERLNAPLAGRSSLSLSAPDAFEQLRPGKTGDPHGVCVAFLQGFPNQDLPKRIERLGRWRADA